MTHICVVDVDGKVSRRDVVPSDPDVLAKWPNRHCTDLARGPRDANFIDIPVSWLGERGVAVECICARHAKGVLSARVSKSHVHDAEGLAHLARAGWYKRVHMKASATHIDRAVLGSDAQLIAAWTSMANQLRGLLKLFGLRMGHRQNAGRNLKPLFAPLTASMKAIEEQLRAYNRLLNDRPKWMGLRPIDKRSCGWTNHCAHLHLDHRRSAAFWRRRRCRCLCRARAQA